MAYTRGRLAKIAGITSRTLRHYEAIDLLKPHHVNDSGYRIYEEEQVDLLQQILFYKSLGLGLEQIKSLMTSPVYEPAKVLEEHLATLKAQQQHLASLIIHVNRAISHYKGEIVMETSEKFEAFKQHKVAENERNYGQEIREKYGEEMVNSANDKWMHMSMQDYQAFQDLEQLFKETLAGAVQSGDPSGADAQKSVVLHKRWLGYTWPNYTEEAHCNLMDMMTADERYQAYFDPIAPNAASFLRDAVYYFCLSQ